MLQRKLPEALAVVQKFSGETLIIGTTAPVPKAFLEGSIHFLEGDKPRAQIEFEKARVVSEQLLRGAPEDAARHAQHGLILAALGRKGEAIAEGKRAVELLPESRDAFDGRDVPLRSHKSMPGPVKLMKQFVCSIISSAFRMASPFQYSSSNQPGIRCAKILGSKHWSKYRGQALTRRLD